ncbi:MAG: sigma-70 family RNA polymerase sigma factor [Bacteroidota bacterium]
MERNERIQIFELEMMDHYKTVYNFLLRLSGNETDAVDLTQETYARAYQKLHLYQEGTNARAWLFRIAHNLFINSVRKQSKRKEEQLDEREAYQRQDDSRSLGTFQDLRQAGALDRDFSDEVSLALNRLPEDQRVVVLMADLYDFSEKEIAEVLKLKLNTVKSRTHRARLKLINILRTFAGQEYGIRSTRNA